MGRRGLMTQGLPRPLQKLKTQMKHHMQHSFMLHTLFTTCACITTQNTFRTSLRHVQATVSETRGHLKFALSNAGLGVPRELGTLPNRLDIRDRSGVSRGRGKMIFCGSKTSLDTTTEKPARPLDTPDRSLVSSCRGTLPRALDTLK